jgi:hypothetical protein
LRDNWTSSVGFFAQGINRDLAVLSPKDHAAQSIGYGGDDRFSRLVVFGYEYAILIELRFPEETMTQPESSGALDNHVVGVIGPQLISSELVESGATVFSSLSAPCGASFMMIPFKLSSPNILPEEFSASVSPSEYARSMSPTQFERIGFEGAINAPTIRLLEESSQYCFPQRGMREFRLCRHDKFPPPSESMSNRNIVTNDSMPFEEEGIQPGQRLFGGCRRRVCSL